MTEGLRHGGDHAAHNAVPGKQLAPPDRLVVENVPDRNCMGRGAQVLSILVVLWPSTGIHGGPRHVGGKLPSTRSCAKPGMQLDSHQLFLEPFVRWPSRVTKPSLPGKNASRNTEKCKVNRAQGRGSRSRCSRNHRGQASSSLDFPPCRFSCRYARSLWCWW